MAAERRERPHDTVHDVFMLAAGASPQAVALREGSQTWTYARLDTQTNRLARRLQVAGVGPETIVGCYLSSPARTVIHILAVLKAGGAYLLLDRQLPEARLQHMLADADPAVLILDSPLPLGVRVGTRALIDTRRLAREGDRLSGAPLRSTATGSNAAYVAYTSGSTGRPKGVVLTHASTVAHARAFARTFALSPLDRVPLMAPAVFDVATEEILPALLSGCRLISSTSAHDDMAAFTDEIIRCRYTILNIPAPLWQRWTAYLGDHPLRVPASLRLVITGSDKIATRTLRDWQNLPGAAGVRWAAAYGVTECTVTSTLYLGAGSDDLGGERLVPIGRPIEGTRCYIVDSSGRLVDGPQVGELLIGGAGVARGYLNRPYESQERFRPDPYSFHPDARLYRTGDLARWRPDGTIVWVGRLDGQLKLRGLRIEPGEIETVIGEHPDVAAAAVALHHGGPDEFGDELRAFVVARTGRVLDAEAVLEAVADRVHPGMVPARLDVLEQLPLTASGKLDRAGLRRLDARACPGARMCEICSPGSGDWLAAV